MNTSKHNSEPEMQQQQDCVILLHGMGRSRFSMLSLQRYLSKAGYQVLNHSYPSTRESIEYLASTHVNDLVEQCLQDGQPNKKIHFVTHSLGGILVRQYLQQHSLPKGSRIVMLAPPNQGSELAWKLKSLRLYRWITGIAGQQLGRGPGGIAQKLAKVEAEIGVIAGSRTLEPWFSLLITGKDDGKVSLQETKLAEMQDFLIVPHGHSFIMLSSTVLKEVACFLRQGRFCQNQQEKYL